MKYKWGRDISRRPWWRLRPEDSPDWHVLNSIATVRTSYDARTGRRVVYASYTWQDTGNAPYGNAVLGSVPQARAWCEEQLAKFWNTPEIAGKP